MKKVTFNVRPTLGQFTAAIFGPVPTESPAMGVNWLSKRITLHSCPCVYVCVCEYFENITYFHLQIYSMQ